MRKKHISNKHKAKLIREGKLASLFSNTQQPQRLSAQTFQSNDESDLGAENLENILNEEIRVPGLPLSDTHSANKLFNFVNNLAKNATPQSKEDINFTLPYMHTPISDNSQVTHLLFVLTLAHIMFQRKWQQEDLQTLLNFCHMTGNYNNCVIKTVYQFKKVSCLMLKILLMSYRFSSM